MAAFSPRLRPARLAARAQSSSALFVALSAFSDFREVLTDTGLVTASISFLIIAAQMYSRMLALSGVPAGFGNFVATAEIGYWGVILAYVLLVILMGTILDSSSIMLILVPLMLPVLGLDAG